MNWQFVKEVAHQKAHSYALQGGHNPEGSKPYADRYNGFMTGYMECAGERESLRAMLSRCELKLKEKQSDISIDDIV